MRKITTRKGEITFPAYLPVTTFGETYPLDNLIRPYLPRLAKSIMVSFYYAKQAKSHEINLPMWVDSGGFVSLMNFTKIIEKRGLGLIEINKDENPQQIVHPKDILEFQEQKADVAFSLDFPISLSTDPEEAKLRQRLTIANARWAIANRRRRDLPLYGVVQGWDLESYKECAIAYQSEPFDGIAIGGLVPRAKNMALIIDIVKTIREMTDLPLHVFGLGQPQMVKKLFEIGVDSIDSSSYVQYASEGKLFGQTKQLEDPAITDRIHLALMNLAIVTGSTLPISMFPKLSTLFQK